MLKSMFNRPISSEFLEQAITKVLNIVTMEETALANILTLESDIIRKAKNNSANLEEFVAINQSVTTIIKNITKVQVMTQRKLQHMENLIEQIENIYENDALEENP